MALANSTGSHTTKLFPAEPHEISASREGSSTRSYVLERKGGISALWRASRGRGTASLGDDEDDGRGDGVEKPTISPSGSTLGEEGQGLGAESVPNSDPPKEGGEDWVRAEGRDGRSPGSMGVEVEGRETATALELGWCRRRARGARDFIRAN